MEVNVSRARHANVTVKQRPVILPKRKDRKPKVPSRDKNSSKTQIVSYPITMADNNSKTLL